MKNDGQIVIGTVVDDSGIDKGIKGIEKKVKSSSQREIELKGKIDFLKSQKDLSNFQREQLEKMQQELDEITGKENEIKVETNFDTVMQDIEKLESQIEALTSKYKDKDVMIDGVKVSGMSGFGANATEEEWANYDKLQEQLETAREKMSQMLAEMKEAKTVTDTQTESVANQGIKYDENLQKIDTLKTKIQEMVADYKDIAKQDIVDDNDLQYLDELKSKISDARTEYEKMVGTKLQIKGFTDFEKIPTQIDKANLSLSNVDKNLNKIGNSVNGVVGKVARWGLAIFGIRSAYMFVRQAMSTLSQYNDQMATDIEYIRYLIASTLQPVIENIIKLVYTLLSYIGYIANAWFGINLFGNASVENFNKMNKGASGVGKSLGSATKQAKELKKQLAGFDEMNILNDTSDNTGGTGGVGGASGAGGLKIPSFDPSLFDGEVPEWLKWIADHGPEIVFILAGIVGALFALKLGFSGLQALGIGLAITGILIAIQSLLAYLDDPSWENFGTVIQGIGLAIIGLGLAIFGLPVAVAGAIVLIVGTVIKYWNQIKSFLQGGIDWLKEQADGIHEKFGDTIGAIYDIFVSILQGILDGFDSMFKGIKEIFDGIIQFVKGVFTGDWKSAINGLAKIFGGLCDFIIGTMKIAWSGVIETVKGAFNFIVNSGKQAFNDLISFIKWAINSIGGLLKDLGTKAGDIIGSAFKGVVNGVLKAIESILNTPISAINALIKTINNIPGVNITKLSTFKLPRLAKGGIINLPGRGVPVGSAIAGERSAEGVIPLTDSQQMQLLGEAIGRYITVNNVLNNYMNGRLISRELQKSDNESAFAFNR